MKKIVLLFTFFFVFYIIFATAYNIPQRPVSIDVADIDLDGDLDIVIGHKTTWGYTNPTISILANDGYGTFPIIDTSLVFCGYQENIFAQNIDNDNYSDIVTFMADFSSGVAERYIRIFYNQFGCFNIYLDFPLNSSAIFSGSSLGDIDSDMNTDIIVISNNSYFWGYLINDGSGQFSTPVYYDLDYPPTDVDVGNLNEDTREDIVISGQTVEIYFNYESGFDCYLLGDNELRVKIADVDNDGDNDIIGLSSILGTSWITIYENLGDSNFYEHDQFLFQSDTSYLQVSDLNNNGLIDLICSGSYNNGIYILYNNGNFDFSEPQFYFTGEDTRKVHCADLDNNNYNDIIALTHYTVAPDFGRLHILFNDGNGNFVEEPQVGINDEFIIKNNKCNLTIHPNPFNPSTNIKFTTSKQGFVEINICNIKGVFVKKLIKQNLVGGEHNVIWNGKDRNNQHCSSGIYLMNLKVDGKTEAMKKCLLLK